MRPETIVHYGHKGGLGGDGLGTALGELETAVEVVEPTGAETMIVIRMAGREVIARVDPEQARPPGTPMRFHLDMRKACLFDPETEKLIG